MPVFTPLDYQQDAIDFMINTPKCAVWIPTSGGKTGITLSYLLKIKRTKQPKAAMLVVCPLSVIQQWQSEVQKFDNFKHFKVLTLRGKNIEQEYLTTENVDIFLINYEALEKITLIIKASKKLRFNILVYDESSKLKNGRSVRFKHAKILSKLCDRTILLSATPRPNTLMDLWAQYYLLDTGERLGTHITHFRNEYFTQAPYNQFVYIPKENAEGLITKKVTDITYRITEDQIPKKVDVTTQLVPFNFSSSILKKYKTLEQELFYLTETENSTNLTADNTITANSVTTKIIKCRQFIQGFIYDHENKTTHPVHKEKLNILLDYLDFINSPIIIAYNFIYEREMLIQAIPHARLLNNKLSQDDFNKTIEEWNDKKIDVLLCNPASISHGLNLQHGGNHIVWYSLTYSYENYIQLIGRLHRIGQKYNVINHILLADDTLDKVIYNALLLKDTSQRTFFDLLLRHKMSI